MPKQVAKNITTIMETFIFMMCTKKKNHCKTIHYEDVAGCVREWKMYQTKNKNDTRIHLKHDKQNMRKRRSKT